MHRDERHPCQLAVERLGGEAVHLRCRLPDPDHVAGHHLVDVAVQARAGQERARVVGVADGQASDGHARLGQPAQGGCRVGEGRGLREAAQDVVDRVLGHGLPGLRAQGLACGRGEVGELARQRQRHRIALEPHEERAQHRSRLPHLLQPFADRIEVEQSLEDVEDDRTNATSHVVLLHRADGPNGTVPSPSLTPEDRARQNGRTEPCWGEDLTGTVGP
nr:hypothetical protein [Ornithinimicrobium kibberense]